MKSELRVRDSLGGLAWNQGDDNVRVQDGGDASSTKTRSSKKPLAGATPMDYFVRVLSGSKTWSPV